MLPGLIYVVADQKDVCQGGYHGDDGEHAMRELPELVPDAQPLAPDRKRNQDEQRYRREYRHLSPPRCGDRVQQREEFGIGHEQQHRVGQDEEQGDVGYLPVELQHDVYAERRRYRLKAGDEGELQAQHGEPHKAQGDGEVDQESPAGRGIDHGEDERGGGQRQIHQDPGSPPDRQLHGLTSRSFVYRRAWHLGDHSIA